MITWNWYQYNSTLVACLFENAHLSAWMLSIKIKFGFRPKMQPKMQGYEISL